MKKFNSLVITGGIGSGKSYVCNIFKQHGFFIISFDELAHMICQSSYMKYSAYAKEVDALCGTQYQHRQEIDRSELREILLKMNAFDKIAHLAFPYILDLATQHYDFHQKLNQEVIFEVPLLFEYDLENLFDKTISVISDLDTRVERIKKRNPNWSLEQIAHRIHIQMSDEEKIKRSDFIIWNRKYDDVQLQVLQIIENYKKISHIIIS